MVILSRKLKSFQAKSDCLLGVTCPVDEQVAQPLDNGRQLADGQCHGFALLKRQAQMFIALHIVTGEGVALAQANVDSKEPFLLLGRRGHFFETLQRTLKIVLSDIIQVGTPCLLTGLKQIFDRFPVLVAAVVVIGQDVDLSLNRLGVCSFDGQAGASMQRSSMIVRNRRIDGFLNQHMTKGIDSHWDGAFLVDQRLIGQFIERIFYLIFSYISGHICDLMDIGRH